MYSSKVLINAIKSKFKTVLSTQKILSPFVVKSLPHLVLKTTDLFSVTIVLPLQGCHINEITQYVAYESGFLHLAKGN